MTWAPFLRAVGASRRARPSVGVAAADGRARIEPHPRHPAMSGLEVSPVHGYYCICDRCTRDLIKPH
jgi:hypothetical protein